MSKLLAIIFKVSIVFHLSAVSCWGCCGGCCESSCPPAVRCCAPPPALIERDAGGLVTRIYYLGRMRPVVPRTDDPERGSIRFIDEERQNVLSTAFMGVNRVKGWLTIGGHGLKVPSVEAAIEDTFMSKALWNQSKNEFEEAHEDWKSYNHRFDAKIPLDTSTVERHIRSSSKRFARYCDEVVLTCSLGHQGLLKDYLSKEPKDREEWLKSPEAEAAQNLATRFLDGYSYSALRHILYRLDQDRD